MLAQGRHPAHGGLPAGHGDRRQQAPQRARRRVELAPAVPCVQLRVLGELRHAAQPRVGDPGLFQTCHQFLGAAGREGALQQGGQRGVVTESGGIVGETRITHQFRPPQHLLAQGDPVPVALHGQEHLTTVAGPVMAVGGDRGVACAAAGQRSVPVEAGVKGLAEPLAERVQHRHVHSAAHPGALALVQGGEDARVGVHPGGDVGHGGAGPGRRLGRHRHGQRH